MLKIFIGFDPRQTVAFTTLAYSLMKHASQPISITPLILSTLPIHRQGLTPFTYSRFLVPWLCDYQGWALFLDCDILANHDITKIMQYADPNKDIIVSENKKRFEWSSVALFNCDHCRMLTPGFIDSSPDIHSLNWGNVGALPAAWNHLVGYDAPLLDPALIHFTKGIPCFPETRQSEHGEAWRAAARESVSALTWQELMGNSVHASPDNHPAKLTA